MYLKVVLSHSNLLAIHRFPNVFEGCKGALGGKEDLTGISNSYAEMVTYTEVLKCFMVWPFFFFYSTNFRDWEYLNKSIRILFQYYIPLFQMV